MRSLVHSLLALLLFASTANAAQVEGELQQWHRVEIQFTGPSHAEGDSSPNPFLDHRLQCRLEGPSGRVYHLPGFFDSDGQGSSAGSLWICRFAPDEVGTWHYRASFRSGTNVAVSAAADAGSAGFFNGESGTFVVAPSVEAGRDFRSADRGRLVNVGDHYLTFLGSGDRWIKGGPDVPENLLGYTGFDNTPNAGHDFSSHEDDWLPGDPDWGGGEGRAIIGALNYIASTGANSIYFLPMNIGGDGKDTFPTLAEQDKTHYDTSKLGQWEIVFTHAQSLGIFLHFQLAETESANENYHDGGELGVQRKLYYRELIARFGHHPGLEWDLGEENDYGTSRREEFAAYIKSLDPYDHPVTTHIHTNQMEGFYGPLLGNSNFDMTAFQINAGGLAQGEAIVEWRERSAAAGVPWVVSIDEPQAIQNDPADESSGYPHGRKHFLWPTYLSGGGGFEWYVQEDGGGHGFDQRVDDFRELDAALTWTGHALEFMDSLPFWLMEPLPGLGASTAGGKTFVLARPGDSYALYNENGGSLELDLRDDGGLFAVHWFDPRTGAWHEGGTVQGGDFADLGSAPFGGDVAALVVRDGDGMVNADPVASFTATPLTGEAPLRVHVDASSSFDDGTITAYRWNLGDEGAAQGVVADTVYELPGDYTVTLEVVDDESATGRASQAIRVLAPVPEPKLALQLGAALGTLAWLAGRRRERREGDPWRGSGRHSGASNQ